MKEFEEMKKLYSSQIRENADVLEKCDTIDGIICALYGFYKLAFTRFLYASEYGENKETIANICTQIDEKFKDL